MIGHPPADLVAQATKAGVAAIVTRHPIPGEPGVALLLAAPEVAWGRLYTLIEAMLALAGSAAPGEPGDLFALANQVAARIGGAVAIEDLAMRVLAYSTIEGQRIDDLRRDGILGLRVPAHPNHAEEYAAVLRANSAIWSYVPVECLPRLGIAVRARGDAKGRAYGVAATGSGAPKSARQAEAALSVLDGPFGRGAVGRYEDLAAVLLLSELGTALRGRPALTGEPLSLVAEHDTAHGTDYLQSLRVWFASYFDVPRAAEVLSLHPNTLRYRLRRISELVDLDDPDIRLALVIQLRLRRTPDRNPTPRPDGVHGDVERHGTAD
ncbi:helix-turn-helix domain-containing protein [Streptosporangium sp. NPDC002544]|uniref:PucR family transcriptional regulator n=1 Tax=Streptosporangium sp. NPDC002544 TaxID=3154538 RepID=UPI003321DEEF